MWLPAIRLFHEVDQHCQVLSSWGTIWDAFVIWWNNNIQENDTTNCCSTSFVRHSFKVSGFQTFTFEMSFDSSQNPPGVLALTVIDVHSANVFFSHSYQPTGPFRWVLLYTNTSTCVCVLFHCEGVLTHFCISPFIHPSVKTSVFHLSLSILISSFLSSQHQS